MVSHVSMSYPHDQSHDISTELHSTWSRTQWISNEESYMLWKEPNRNRGGMEESGVGGGFLHDEYNNAELPK